MRKAQFDVPSEVMAEFAQAMATRNLSNSVTGTARLSWKLNTTAMNPMR